MIVFIGDRINNVVPEGCITAWALVLMLGHEEALATASAGVDSCVFRPPIGTCEWSLSSSALSDVERVRSQLLLQTLFHFSLVLSQPLLENFLILKLSGRAVG